MNFILKVVVGALLVTAGVGICVAALGFALYMLIPLAFPAIIWTYWNALALAFLMFLVGLPWLIKD